MEQTYLIDIINKYTDPPLADGIRGKIAAHYRVLLEWSSVFNLTGTGDTVELAEALYLDAILTSRWAASVLHAPAVVHDVGSGAGFPGLFLPLFLAGNSSFTLHEARRKKSSFLRTAAVAMGLGGVIVENDRVVHGAFNADLVTSRATFPPRDWLAFAATLLKRGGVALVYLSEHHVPDEDLSGLASSEPAMRLKETFRYLLPISGRKRAACLFERT